MQNNSFSLHFCHNHQELVNLLMFSLRRCQIELVFKSHLNLAVRKLMWEKEISFRCASFHAFVLSNKQKVKGPTNNFLPLFLSLSRSLFLSPFSFTQPKILFEKTQRPGRGER